MFISSLNVPNTFLFALSFKSGLIESDRSKCSLFLFYPFIYIIMLNGIN
ncbi:MAG: hypothetical protein ACKPKO_20880 [Candidatus Fonsibacter sp.]